MNVTNEEILKLIQKYKKMCVIGLSRDSSKPSQKVPQFLRSKGYDIVGVHPSEKSIAEFPCYSSLSEVPGDYRKFVDVFRPASDIPRVVDEVLKVGGVEVLFLQLGISHPEAEARAESAGIKVVSNRCLHIEYMKIK